MGRRQTGEEQDHHDQAGAVQGRDLDRRYILQALDGEVEAYQFEITLKNAAIGLLDDLLSDGLFRMPLYGPRGGEGETEGGTATATFALHPDPTSV